MLLRLCRLERPLRASAVGFSMRNENNTNHGDQILTCEAACVKNSTQSSLKTANGPLINVKFIVSPFSILLWSSFWAVYHKQYEE